MSLTELAKAELDIHITKKGPELVEPWMSAPFSLSPAEVVEAIAKFKELAVRYINAGMPLGLAVKSADCAALAIATHSKKVIQAMEATGQTGFSPDSSTTIARIGRITKYVTCSMIMYSVAEQMNLSRRPSLDDLEAAFAGGEPNYEETPIKAFQFFLAGHDQKNTLLS